MYQDQILNIHTLRVHYMHAVANLNSGYLRYGQFKKKWLFLHFSQSDLDKEVSRAANYPKRKKKNYLVIFMYSESCFVYYNIFWPQYNQKFT